MERDEDIKFSCVVLQFGKWANTKRTDMDNRTSANVESFVR